MVIIASERPKHLQQITEVIIEAVKGYVSLASEQFSSLVYLFLPQN